MKKTMFLLSMLTLSTTLAGAATLPFKPYETLNAGVNPRGLAVGDVTGDGIPDLVVANFGSRTFIGQDTPSTVLNPMNCTLQLFSPSSSGLVLKDTIQTNFSPRGVAILNLDGQGGAEVLATAYDAGRLQVYTFTDHHLRRIEEELRFDQPVGVAAASPKAGWPIMVAVANFSSNKVSLFEVAPDGRLKGRVEVPVKQGPTQVAFGDVNGDGLKEIIVSCIKEDRLDIISLPAGSLQLDLQQAAVSSSLEVPPGGEPADLEAVDLDGDGRVDVAACNFIANTLAVFNQDTGGILQARPVVPTDGNRPNGMTVADLDRDGIQECVVANRDSDLVDVFRADETGGYVLDGTYPVADDEDKNLGPVEVAVLDVDLDGACDVVVSHMRSNTLRILRQDIPVPSPTPVPNVAVFSEETTVAYPNPSGGKVTVRFNLSGPCDVEVRIFDIAGQPVWGITIPAARTRRGSNELEWEAKNQSWAPVASGTYLLSLTAEGRTVIKRVMIIR